jgi:peptidoglycan/xylan/chitin deacetylase (PgdA/CDA1 family)
MKAARKSRMAAAGRVARTTGAGAFARWLAPEDSIRIPLTHAVLAEHLPRFEQIVRFLLEVRRPITPAEFFRYYEHGSPERVRGRTFVYSFDDGLLSSYEATRRVLDPLGIKAMFFVPTQMLELETPDEMRQFAWERVYLRRRPLESLRPEDYLMMGVPELRELHSHGHAIFPHTYSHIYIADIESDEDVQRELIRPKQVVEEILQSPADAFAFPIGTERVLSAYSYQEVAKVYSYCFTALMGHNTETTHPLLLHRDAIHPWFSSGHVRNIVEGVYDPYHRLRARRLRADVGLPRRRPMAVEIAADASPPAGHISRRQSFIADVARALDEAAVDYVVLHDFDSPEGHDSDIDIAVERGSRHLVDTLIRTGKFGRVVQRLHYADPWSSYYVVEVGEPGRRFRQLDVVCDPWGIGRDGPAIPAALRNPARYGGIRVAAPAARTLYLAVKRARKAGEGTGGLTALRSAYYLDPERADDLLAATLGTAGERLAAALRTGEQDLSAELDAVRRRLERTRRRPLALLLRAWFTPARIVGRIRRPTGLVVVLAAPDGVGKSTLAAALPREASGAFRRSVRLHLRPGLLPSPAHVLGRRGHDAAPHAVRPSGRLGSAARLAYLWFDTLLGWGPKVAVPRIKTALVVVERGWLDLAVDPLRYRLSLPRGLVLALGRLQPRPDLVLKLEVSPEVARERKPELPLDEIERQNAEWTRLADADPRRFATVDAGADADEVAREAADRVVDALAERQRRFEGCALALRCLGGLRVGGNPYTIISAPRWPARRAPRWVVPSGIGSPGPTRTQLYRPARGRHLAGAVLLDAAQAVGGGRLATQVSLDSGRGLGPLVASKLGKRAVVLAAAATGGGRRGERALLSVRADGHIVAFAKVARQEATKLHHEARILRELARLDLDTLVVPRVIDCFDWQDCTVLLLEPFRVRLRADRSTGSAEVAGLVELTRLGAHVGDFGDGNSGHVLVHGDFAPWNCAPLGPSSLALWDWEEARMGMPLEDLFYWRVQRLLRFGRGRAVDLVESAMAPDPEILTLCAETGTDPAVAPDALAACLRRRFGVSIAEVDVVQAKIDALARVAR